MKRWIRQFWCNRRGHPYPTTTVPICGRWPHSPDVDATYCNGCGFELYTEFTDGAGTERRTQSLTSIKRGTSAVVEQERRVHEAICRTL